MTYKLLDCFNQDINIPRRWRGQISWNAATNGQTEC